jgi:hypothetical protein
MMMRHSIIFIVVAIALGPIGLAAADGIGVSNVNATYQFARSMTLTITASSDAPITQAAVFYQTANQTPIRQAADPFTPANQVDLQATIVFTETRPPAFSAITYWWEIADQSGKTVRTEVATLAYFDNRFKWQDLTSGKVRVHWVTGDSGFGATAATIANEALPRIQQQLGVEPPSPIDLYIYPTLDELRNAVELAGRPWLGGQARPELGVVMVAIPTGDTATIEMRRDIPHELTHLMVFVAARPGFDTVPAWLDEGLATLNEAEPDSNQAVALQDAYTANQLPSLESLCGALPTEATSALAAYAESRGVVQQIVDTYGSAGIQALVAAYRDGATCAGGVERGLNVTLNSIELKWRSTLGPASPAAAVAKTSGPWIILSITVVLPLIIALAMIRRPAKRDKMTG